MQIQEVTIHGFRGIAGEISARFDNYSLLVGANNAGKSTVFSAICAFYEKDGFKFNESKDTPTDTSNWDRETWVEITYQVTDAERDSLKTEYQSPDNLLRLRKYFVSKDSDRKLGLIYAISADDDVSDKSFYGAKNVQSGKLGNLILIPAVSRVDDHTKLTGPSVLRDLLAGLLGDVLEGSGAFKDLKTHFEVFVSQIKTQQASNGSSIQDFEQGVSNELKSWGIEFELQFNPPQTAEIIKGLTGYALSDEEGNEIRPEQCGSGFQRHFIASLIRVAAEYELQKAGSKSKDFQPDLTVLLFEEPEAFLHPPLQCQLARNLRQLASANARQVICSTHSPHFVSKNASDLKSMIRLRNHGGIRTCHQISESDWDTIVVSNQSIVQVAQQYPNSQFAKNIHTDDLKAEMEAVKNSLWLDSDRSSAFFGGHVLLVEGPTEVAFINRLVDDGRINPGPEGLTVIDTIGKYNIHRFIGLFSCLGIDHFVMHDDDSHGDPHHQGINRLIDDTAKQYPSFCRRIQTITGDLERLLSVPPCKQSHRKPQHLLFKYGNGDIDDTKIKSFCGLVNGLISAA